jgi:enediyne biosynthesis protein E4
MNQARSFRRPTFALAMIGSVLLLASPIFPEFHQWTVQPDQRTATPKFVDVAQIAGVHFRTETSATSQKYLVETMGGGVAVFDYDGDGRMDLFFVNGARLSDPMAKGERPDKSDPKYWNRLYHNNGDGTFTDVTEKSGLKGCCYGMGVAVGDFDNDGRPDLYVTGWDSNVLYHNNGDGTFSDVTASAGVRGGGWSTSAAFVDYDGDGYLDIFVTRYLAWDFSMNIWCGDPGRTARSFCHPNVFQPVTSILYHNNHDGTFTDVSEQAGINRHPGNGLGVAINDYDHDGRIDIAVANDARPQQLFRNLGNGKFEEVGAASGIAWGDNGETFSGMGIEFRDYENNGWPGILITDLANQSWDLFRNVKGLFQNVSAPSGIETLTLRHSGWGAKFVDLDNDGWKDLIAVQGHVMDDIAARQPGLLYQEAPVVFRNDRGTFRDISSISGPAFADPIVGRGAAVGDLNNDGFEDIVITALNGEAKILQNKGNGNHWILIRAVGTVSNRDGIGAQIHIRGESGLDQWDVVSGAGGYLSASDERVHFGLGGDRLVKSIDVRWPSGILQRLSDIAADQILTVREPSNGKQK